MFFRELNRGNCKTYLVGCERTRKAALIDPIKDRVDRYLAALAYHGYRLEYAIDTHTHADHRAAAWDLRELAQARVVMHRRATGRADFAGGDPGAQYDSITGKLFALPDATVVYPAHDYRGQTHTTIGEEKRANPRIAGRTRAAYVELMNN